MLILRDIDYLKIFRSSFIILLAFNLLCFGFAHYLKVDWWFILITASTIILVFIALYLYDLTTTVLFSIFILIFIVRLYPYFDGLPVGVDSIRDLIYSTYIMESGHVPKNFPRQVDYYESFPSLFLISILTSLVSGASLEITYFPVNSIVLALSSIPLILITRRVIGRSYIPAIIYATIPTVVTWGYWIIPMSLSTLYMIYSIYLMSIISSFTILNRGVIKPCILSFIFIIMAVFTHPVVGTLNIAFILVCTIHYIVKRLYSMGLIFSILFLCSTILSYLYWKSIGFMVVFTRGVNTILNNLVRGIENIYAYLIRPTPATRTIITPQQVEHGPATAPTVGPQEIYDFLNIRPLETQIYHLIPRWIWSILLIVIPLTILIINRRKEHIFAKSIGIFGLSMGIFTALSLFMQIIWKADRYLGYPATIFLIVYISIFKFKLDGKTRKIIFLLIIILVISGLLDPRVSFYTNPLEGSRVTFNLNEREAVKYSVNYSYEDKPVLITDYNLMTSLTWYYSEKLDKPVNLKFTPIYSGVNHFYGKSQIILVLRKYSIESTFIWSLNFKPGGKIYKFILNSSIIYDNLEGKIFYK